MSQQTVCDKCDKMIDRAAAYWSVSVAEVRMDEDTLTAVSQGRQLDFHDHHLPSELRPPGPPEAPPEPTQLPTS